MITRLLYHTVIALAPAATANLAHAEWLGDGSPAAPEVSLPSNPSGGETA